MSRESSENVFIQLTIGIWMTILAICGWLVFKLPKLCRFFWKVLVSDVKILVRIYITFVIWLLKLGKKRISPEIVVPDAMYEIKRWSERMP